MTSNQTDTYRIILDKVYYQYCGRDVLQNISFKVDDGEFVVLVGPSGCGKTTLLDLLSGYKKPHTGKIINKGVIRTVHQENGLFPWLTVSENISMGLRGLANISARDPELKMLIELVKLDGFENYYPHQLSGGMRQRVELARALTGDSDILLMDEPFSSLDYQTRYLMRKELLRLLNIRPKTVVFVTHDIEEAVQLADRVLVLSNRPGHICFEMVITVPRPREITDFIVADAVKTIINELNFMDPTVNKSLVKQSK